MFCLSEQSGKIDMTFFTHDCFHFTIKGHEELAKGLWNNMVNNDSHCLCLVAQEVKGQQSPHCQSEGFIMWSHVACVLTKGWNIIYYLIGKKAAGNEGHSYFFIIFEKQALWLKLHLGGKKKTFSIFKDTVHLLPQIHSSSLLCLLITVSAWGRKDDCEQLLWPHQPHLSTYGRTLLLLHQPVALTWKVSGSFALGTFTVMKWMETSSFLDEINLKTMSCFGKWSPDDVWVKS